MGLDVGRVTDPSAACIIDAVSGQIEHTEIFPKGLDHAVQARRAGELAREWNDALVVIDATGGGAPAKGKGDEYVQLYKAACPNHRLLYQVWQNQKTMFECTSLQIEQGQVNIPESHTALLEQIEQFEVVFKNGYWRFGSPNHADDLVSAFAMIVFARKEGWIPTSNGRVLAPWN